MGLTGTITPSQSRLGSNGNERVLQIPQSPRTGASSSDILESSPGHLLGKSYTSVEMQLAYSTAPADWAGNVLDHPFG